MMRLLSLRARFVLLVLVGVIPFLSFNLGSVYIKYQQDRTEADARMLNAARALALAVEGELRLRVGILQVLALSAALANDDIVAFRAEAEAVRVRQEPGTHILLLRGDGQQLMNTAVPLGSSLPVRAQMDNVNRVFATSRPSVSDVFEGRVLHKPIVAIETPVYGPDGVVHLVLSLTPRLEAFDSIIWRQIADQNLRAAIIDRNGRRIARFPVIESLAGPVQSPDFMKIWSPGREGTVRLVLPDGEPRVFGFSPVAEFGWTVVVGISAAQLVAPAWRAAMMTSAVGFGLLMIGAALAQLLSRSVIGPISKLARLASAAESGGDARPVSTGLQEIDQVATILLTEARARALALADQARDSDALRQSNKALAEEITRREDVESALLSAKEAAEQASQTKSRFLTIITHELRTPLHGILGCAELLSLEGGLNPAQYGRVATMIAAGEHLLGMINAVLDVSMIEAGRLELHPAKIALAELAQSCLNVVRPAAEAKGLALTLTAATVDRVVADVTRLRQVLINLLGNAVKFTPSGKVDLRLRQAGSGERVRLEVVDTGPGIWDRHRDKLFQTFERLNANAVAGIEGTGLGLALAAQLVEAMDGRIGYENNPDGGSIFWVELPAAPDGPVAPDFTVTSNRDTRPGVRVLVVDDDALNRDIACRFLTLGGHEVVCLDNGVAAVEAAKAEDFDVILMDVRMPGMNGLEATRLIRLLPGSRGAVPVIALTAQSFSEQIEICRRAGMNTHVSKPFTQATVLAAIANSALPAKNTTAPTAVQAAAVPEHLIFDRPAFDEAIGFLPQSDAADYLRSLITRGEALACGLGAPEIRSQANDLAESVHKFAGAAAMLGFRSLADIGRRFEFAADTDEAEMIALAAPLAAAVLPAVTILRQKLAEMSISAM